MRVQLSMVSFFFKVLEKMFGTTAVACHRDLDKNTFQCKLTVHLHVLSANLLSDFQYQS